MKPKRRKTTIRKSSKGAKKRPSPILGVHPLALHEREQPAHERMTPEMIKVTTRAACIWHIIGMMNAGYHEGIVTFVDPVTDEWHRVRAEDLLAVDIQLRVMKETRLTD